VPSLQPTKQNPVLASIAAALNRTRGFLNPAEGTPLHSVDWFRPGNLLMGGFPEEVREWSYGNAPFQQTPLGDRLPKPKRTTWERMDTGERETVNRGLTSLDALLAAPTELAAKGAVAGAPMMMGAIRKGGEAGAVASHTTDSIHQLQSIRDKGLFAPSIGLTYQRPSDYHGYNPHFVFKEGALDRPFEGQIPPGIWNRDAYVWNPSFGAYRADPVSHSIEEQWARRGPLTSWEQRLAKAGQDMRLTQMSPGASQSAAIMASPRFSSLRDWEQSPFGMEALNSRRKELGYLEDPNLANYAWTFDELSRRAGMGESTENVTPEMVDFLTSIPAFARMMPQSLDKFVKDDAVKLLDLARKAPSAMGEMKIYAPSVPAGPDEARIFLPPGQKQHLDMAEKLGYDTWTAGDLSRLENFLGLPSDTKNYSIDLLSAPGSTLKARDFREKSRSMIGPRGSPPSEKAPPFTYPPDEPFTDSLDEAAATIPSMPNLFPELDSEFAAEIADVAKNFGISSTDAQTLYHAYLKQWQEPDLVKFAHEWIPNNLPAPE
jgi:hypothetical protein